MQDILAIWCIFTVPEFIVYCFTSVKNRFVVTQCFSSILAMIIVFFLSVFFMYFDASCIWQFNSLSLSLTVHRFQPRTSCSLRRYWILRLQNSMFDHHEALNLTDLGLVWFWLLIPGMSQIYRGYVDDPRNTDNSWMETIAYHFHDEDGTSVGQFQLHAGDHKPSLINTFDVVGVALMNIMLLLLCASRTLWMILSYHFQVKNNEYLSNTVFARSGPLYATGVSLGPPESSTQMASRLLHPFRQGSLGDRLTDHTTQSVTSGGIYVRSSVMWSSNM